MDLFNKKIKYGILVAALFGDGCGTWFKTRRFSTPMRVLPVDLSVFELWISIDSLNTFRDVFECASFCLVY
jgi:hypothetical protein